MIDLSYLLLDLVLSSDKWIILGNFNIHVDADADSLDTDSLNYYTLLGFFRVNITQLRV